MKHTVLCYAVASVFLLGCKATPVPPQATAVVLPANPLVRRMATDKQAVEIKALIDQLVFESGAAKNQPVYSPGVMDDTEEYNRRFKRCQQAFDKLREFKELALPFLVAHLDDQRQSIIFRNHYIGHSVGNACYWNLYCQLQDRPDNYSEYGCERTGRDGCEHPKPYWTGTPFAEAGGLKKWLEVNKDLRYPEMQIKCLQWLLEGEKAIGACDAESYFQNILPLEIRILERKLEIGENVTAEIKRLRKVLARKDAKAIPAELLPGKTKDVPTQKAVCTGQLNH